MGFNKRHLTEESIRDFAKYNPFQWFERYMVHADGYICESGFASNFFKEFNESDETKRKLLHTKLIKDKHEIRKTDSIF